MAVETFPASMKLYEYINANLTVPFAWGYNDCVTFAANWVEIACGRNYMTEFGEWHSAFQAERVLRNNGGLKMIVDRILQPIHMNIAVDGDIALHKNCLRLFSGRHIVGPGIPGLLFFDRKEAECAWHCP